MRKYARMRGISDVAVSKAVKSRRITLTKGKIDPVKADQQWRQNTQPGQRAVNTRRKPYKAASQAAAADPGQTRDAPEPPPNSYAGARARRENILAKIAEADYQQQMSELVNAAELRAAIAKLHTEAKTRILGVSSKIKSRIPGLSGADLSIIDDLLREALGEIASGNG